MMQLSMQKKIFWWTDFIADLNSVTMLCTAIVPECVEGIEI